MEKYTNAKDVLPEQLVKEIQKHVQGKNLYIPRSERKAWGSNSGMKEELEQRNMQILIQHRDGVDFTLLSKIFCLSEERIKAIIYGK